MRLLDGSFQRGEFELLQEVQYLLFFEVANVADDLNLLVFVLAPHAFFDWPFLVDYLRGLIFFHDDFQFLKVEVFGVRDNGEEELIVDEDYSLFGFLGRDEGTTMGVRLVLRLEK